MPTLLWKDERDTERRFVLGGTATIGRSGENAIVLRDTLVSRKHCSIEKRGEEWWLVDHASRYGTYANDERVTGERRLAPGDRLRIGNVPMRFSGEEALDVEVKAAPPTGEPTGPGAGTGLDARVVSATSRISSARDLAARIARELESPASDRVALAKIAHELEGRMTAAETALADLERDKLLGQTLGTVGHLMSLVTDVDTVLNMTLDQAVRVLGADRGFVLLRGEDGKLAPRVQRNMGSLRGISTASPGERCSRSVVNPRMSVKRTVISRLFPPRASLSSPRRSSSMTAGEKKLESRCRCCSSCLCRVASCARSMAKAAWLAKLCRKSTPSAPNMGLPGFPSTKIAPKIFWSLARNGTHMTERIPCTITDCASMKRGSTCASVVRIQLPLSTT
ncbi:MAG TPA: FHA domain-containing protein, partial [bacterium]|nr:FHA domain-containing protein [bacterium]